MNKQKFLKYLYPTSINTNRNIMESLLQDIDKPVEKTALFDFIEEQIPDINPSILDLYLAKVFEDFGDGVTYTVRIDTTNSDPLACCTYLDGAADMQKGSSDWDNKPIFNEIKPCVFKDGKVVYYLNPQFYIKKSTVYFYTVVLFYTIYFSQVQSSGAKSGLNLLSLP